MNNLLPSVSLIFITTQAIHKAKSVLQWPLQERFQLSAHLGTGCLATGKMRIISLGQSSTFLWLSFQQAENCSYKQIGNDFGKWKSTLALMVTIRRFPTNSYVTVLSTGKSRTTRTFPPTIRLQPTDSAKFKKVRLPEYCLLNEDKIIEQMGSGQEQLLRGKAGVMCKIYTAHILNKSALVTESTTE